jgi:WD40 repeat protein
MGDIVGKKLIIAGFDNRVRIYDVHPDNGIQKLHVFIGHVQNIYNMQVIDDSIFTSYSYDGTIRWWNIQAKNCFSYYNVIIFIYIILFSLKNTLEMTKYCVLICRNFRYNKKSMPNLIDKDVL